MSISLFHQKRDKNNNLKRNKMKTVNIHTSDIKLQNIQNEVYSVCKKHRIVADRESELASMGYLVTEKGLRSGGVGQVKESKDSYFIQIGYGHGRYNYAKCVVVDK